MQPFHMLFDTYQVFFFFTVDQFNNMKSCEDTYYCTVIVDTIKDRVVGAATLLLERKFIRNCSKVKSSR